MFKKFFIMNCNKDNTIHNYYQDSNSGKSYVLSLLHNYEYSHVDPRYSRVLLDFNFNDLVNYFGIHSLTSNSFTATLFLSNLKYDEYDHSMEYNIDLFPLTSNWSEGLVGTDEFDEQGFSNWNYRFNGSLWSSSGGDYTESLSSTCYLEDGISDIKFDITEYINNFLYAKMSSTALSEPFSSTSDFRGFLLKFSNEGLSSFSEYKRFYSSETHTIYNPKILVTMENQPEYDSRMRLIPGKEQTLYFPYFYNGKINSLDSITSEIGYDYFVYDGEFGYSVTGLVPFEFSIKKDNELLNLSYTANQVQSGIWKVSFNMPASAYSSSSNYYDIWSITGSNSITGQFNVVTESDLISLNHISLTGNFNKNYISHSSNVKLGVSCLFEKFMSYETNYYLKFIPYLKTGYGVDNLGLLFNNDMIFPDEFYVKFVDKESNYDWTDWNRLDLLNDSYIMELNTKSFRIGAMMYPIFKIKYWNSYTIIPCQDNVIYIKR